MIADALAIHGEARTAELERDPCGFLLGTGEGRAAALVELIVGSNTRYARETGFSLSATEHRIIAEKARPAGRRVEGLWVVHRDGPARPSRMDRETLTTFAADGGPSLLLVVGMGSGTSTVVRAYRCRDDQVQEVRIRT